MKQKILLVLFLMSLGFNAGSAGAVKNTCTVDDVVKLNLKRSDVPEEYALKLSKTGLKMMDEAKAQSCVAADESYFETPGGRSNIDASLRLYNNISQIDCVFEKDRRSFSKQLGALNIDSAPRFGQKSMMFVDHQKDQKTEDIDIYELRFYYGNVLASVNVRGPVGSVSQSMVEKYGRILNQRLKKYCPNCMVPPSCTE